MSQPEPARRRPRVLVAVDRASPQVPNATKDPAPLPGTAVHFDQGERPRREAHRDAMDVDRRPGRAAAILAASPSPPGEGHRPCSCPREGWPARGWPQRTRRTPDANRLRLRARRPRSPGRWRRRSRSRHAAGPSGRRSSRRATAALNPESMPPAPAPESRLPSRTTGQAGAVAMIRSPEADDSVAPSTRPSTPSDSARIGGVRFGYGRPSPP